MNIPFVDLRKQHAFLKGEILEAISSALDNASFIGGPLVESFEREFAKFCEASHCVGVSSGTDALRFALIASGVKPGDEVITVPNTFIATVEAISQVGARPVLVDIESDTFNMDPELIEEKISEKTTAILPVHLYGQPANMGPILDIAEKYNLKIIEDACQAHGARYKGKRVGAFGSAGCFSFYPGKNLGACGEGGAVITDNADIANHIRMLRDHGQIKKYFHEIEGYNGRLDAIQAAILSIKLKQLEGWNEKRREAASLYTNLLSDVDQVKTPVEADYSHSVFHLYVILAENRDNLLKYLTECEIGVGLHYPLPIHMQKAYSHLGYKKGDFPVTESVANKLLSLPLFPEIRQEQIEFVVEKIKEFYSKF